MSAKFIGINRCMKLSGHEWQQGNFDRSLAILRQGLNHNPKSLRLICRYTYALSLFGRHDDAIATAENGLEINPGHIECLAMLANALRRAGKIDPAIRTAVKAVNLAPDDTRGRNTLAVCYLHKRDYGRAFAVALKSSTIEPTQLGTKRILADTCLGLRDYFSFDVIAAQLPDDAAKAYLIAKRYFLQNKTHAALGALQPAIAQGGFDERVCILYLAIVRPQPSNLVDLNARTDDPVIAYIRDRFGEHLLHSMQSMAAIVNQDKEKLLSLDFPIAITTAYNDPRLPIKGSAINKAAAVDGGFERARLG